MTRSINLRRVVFFVGLAMVLLSFGLGAAFPNNPPNPEPPTPMPEPDMLALMGIGGAVAMLAALIRRKDK